MALLNDWIELARSTFRSLNTSDVTNIYALEWPETRRMLVAEQQEEIDRQKGSIRRGVRTASAIVYGLTRKLAPARRILFVAACALFFFCTFSLFTELDQPSFSLFAGVAGAFIAMVVLLAMELIDKIKFRDELQLARELQASLIPQKMPEHPDWDVAAFNWIANTVGGDIYDFVPLQDGRLAVLFGDASGHGMAAGLVMAVAHASFRTQLDVDPAPEAIVTSLNRILCRTGGSRSFFACAYLLLEPDGSYSATLAGHPEILHIGDQGQLVERIGRGAYPLGVKQGIAWETINGRLGTGERLLLHSDGLTESRNAAGVELGDTCAELIARREPQASASRLVNNVVAQWRMFIGSRPAEDDVSIAVLLKR